MAPHLTPAELDFIHAQDKKGQTPVSIHKMLFAKRPKKNLEAPHLTNVRRALKGNTYKRSRKETRGRKKLYSRKMVLKMDKAREQLTKKIANNREVLWRDVRKAARVPEGHRTTLGELVAPSARLQGGELQQRTGCVF